MKIFTTILLEKLSWFTVQLAKVLKWKFIQLARITYIFQKWKRFWLSLLIAGLFGLILLYQWYLDSLETSHVYSMVIIYALSMLFWHLKKLREWWSDIIDFLGLEKSFTTGGFMRLQISIFGGFMISIYLLLSGENTVIPPVLQFSIIPVTATLGGLVISGANYSKIAPDKRAELLRVAQNLIVATIAFVFFATMLSLSNIGGNIDPNQIPLTSLGWIKLILFWFAVVSFFSGTTLFVMGVINLAVSLKHLKKE